MAASFEQTLTVNFRVLGFRVVIEPWFWVLPLVMASNRRGPAVVAWVAVVFVSILLHELGHALAGRAFGADSWIRLYTFGGLTYPDRRLRRWPSLAVSLAGPFAGFTLGAAAYAALRFAPVPPGLPAEVLGMLLWANIAWGLFNLLPVPPLDGGQAMQSVLGPSRARTAAIIGGVVAGAVALWGLASQQLYLGVMFGLLAYNNLARAR